MPEHSPAPWRIGDAGHTIFGPPNGQPSPETIAHVNKRVNAPVLRAAPEMLAALLLARGYILGSFSDNPLDVIEAVIASAEVSHA